MTKATAEERFWMKVEKTDSCWLWTSALSERGYAWFWADSRRFRAHRWIYELLIGPIPEGLEIDHTCCVRRCVNPAHLEPVTHQENIRRSIPARWAKTHCRRGHELTPENTYDYKGRQRFCKTCRADYQRKRASGN